jgi:hypothetical protein
MRSFAEVVKNDKIIRNQYCFAELMSEPNEPSLASQKCTGGEKNEFF